MKIVFYASKNTGPWLAAIASALSDAKVWLWTPEEAGRQADYAIVWQPPAELFASQKGLKAVFNIGAGVDGLMALPNLPGNVPIVRLNDAGMASQMAEYVSHALIRHVREFDVYSEQMKERRWKARRPANRMDFPVGFTDRKDSYIVYLKEGDAIIDFLAMLHADKAVEEFEIARNIKEVRSQVNRLVNCETANLQKAVDAAGRQLHDIEVLQRQEGGLAALPERLRETAEARLEEPGVSIVELGEMLGVSKSGVNHRLRKLHALAAAAEKAEEKEGDCTI